MILLLPRPEDVCFGVQLRSVLSSRRLGAEEFDWFARRSAYSSLQARTMLFPLLRDLGHPAWFTSVCSAVFLWSVCPWMKRSPHNWMPYVQMGPMVVSSSLESRGHFLPLRHPKLFTFTISSCLRLRIMYVSRVNGVRPECTCQRRLPVSVGHWVWVAGRFLFCRRTRPVQTFHYSLGFSTSGNSSSLHRCSWEARTPSRGSERPYRSRSPAAWFPSL